MTSGGGGTTEARVTLEQPEKMCLLGLLLRALLEDNLAGPRGQARARKIAGDIEVSAGGMTITLRFAEGRLTVRQGGCDEARARVRGSLPALLAVARGGGVVGPFLRRKIRIGGNPFLMLRMLPLLRVPKARAGGV